MENNRHVDFDWNCKHYEGYIEKEYENSFLIAVENPCKEITDKYMDRMVVSKKFCTES